MTQSIEIHIHSLGPIRNSRLEVTPFMVFSGESGTGKSYTSLLVHYIYRILCSREMSRFFQSMGASFDEQKAQLPDSNGGKLCEFTLEQFEAWLGKDAIKYVGEMLGNFSLQGDVSIRFSGLEANYQLTYKKEVIEMEGEMMYYDTIYLNRVPLRLPYRSEGWGEIPYVVLFSAYLRGILGIRQTKTFIMPPSRGGIVCLNDMGRTSFVNSQGGLYNAFISDLSELKSQNIPNESPQALYSSLSRSLINGTINQRDNDLYYEQAYGEIPITASAASIKELAPFILMLQKGVVSQYAVMFEEPETNLHPELQIQMADTLVGLLQEGCRFHITTHSDYFLRRINDLIRLDVLSRKLSPEAYAEFCKQHHYNPSLRLDIQLVKAYYFKHTSSYEVEIREQDARTGIPFDTFQSVLDHQLTDSSYLYDQISEAE